MLFRQDTFALVYENSVRSVCTIEARGDTNYTLFERRENVFVLLDSENDQFGYNFSFKFSSLDVLHYVVFSVGNSYQWRIQVWLEPPSPVKFYTN